MAIQPEEKLPHQGLDQRGRQARYGLSYLRNVCAQAGVTFDEGSPDEDVLAIDCKLGFPEADIRVQVKCTTRQLGRQSGSLSWSVDQGMYAKWGRNGLPVYFVLVVVPEDCDTWLDYTSDDETLHRTAAYWAEIDRQRVAPPWTVGVERQNRFTPETLVQWHQALVGGGFGGAL